uniref:Uncharacterized protein n=1 Tax=Candidatus Kentrum sp. FM TaxID=2126340 RepID=A0A450VQK8_9GAMM|nr:MAG: hypothetical protein BECKFM1743A_GA0114220_1003012 [Candidatus Kentron sp. FM]VFJ46025.1 MAG: hypothetical protein BECKFM1743C_GA0114222_1003312 [Candidatus Kentron sp. FM]VFK07064.1 MAG: hypothetical protein BECKFM1743B_GA0114221_1003012 [Candidatus Kentron sp. FM]
METLLKLLQALFSSPWALLILVMGVWLYYNYKIILASDSEDAEKNRRRANSRNVRLGWIEQHIFERRYLDILGYFLDWFGSRLTKDEESLDASRHRGSWPVRLFGLDPFSEGGYLLCLRLAFFYPIVGFFITWFLGGAGEFSGVEFFPSLEGEWLRLLVSIGILLLGWLLSKAIRIRDKFEWVHLMVATAFTTIAVITIAVTLSTTTAFFIDFVVIVCTTIPVGFAIALFFATPFGAIATAFAVTFSVMVTSSIATLVIFDAAAPFTVAIAIIGFVIGVLAVTRFSAWLRERLTSRRGITGYWLNFNLLSAGYAVLMLIWAVPRISDLKLAPLLLLPIFLAILPLANAALDWVSLGVTRGLLYAIRFGHHTGLVALGWVLLDIVLAILFLCAVAVLTTLLLAGINAATTIWGSGPLLDLELLFDELALRPASIDFIWIHFMMLSTLIPTLIHFFIAGFAIVLILPSRLRQWMIQNFDTNEDARLLAFLYVSFMPLLALAVPAGLLWSLYTLVGMHHGAVGMGLLEWVRGIATFVDPSMT